MIPWVDPKAICKHMVKQAAGHPAVKVAIAVAAIAITAFIRYRK